MLAANCACARSDRGGTRSALAHGMTNFKAISTDILSTITGGKNDDPPVSAETIGCAVGGALASGAGPAGTAAGCIGGGAIANRLTHMSNADRAKFTKS